MKHDEISDSDHGCVIIQVNIYSVHMFEQSFYTRHGLKNVSKVSTCRKKKVILLLLEIRKAPFVVFKINKVEGRQVAP